MQEIKNIKDIQEIIRQVVALVEQVDQEWNNLDDEAQECWENFALNIKL